MTQHYLLYGHGGSFNHGGEALARTTISLLRQKSPECRITLSTHFPEQDRIFNIDVDEFIQRNMDGHNNEEVYAATLERITPDSICIHLGGDNYCYHNWQRYAAIHYRAIERGAKSVLWSCSIDPVSIDEEMLRALRTHHLIAAREQITYDTLLSYGLKNVIRVSDIAFTLKPEQVKFELKNFVAINFGPLVVRKNSLIQPAFQRLIDYILKETDMKVVLIPHVLAPSDNDCEALSKIKIQDPKRIIFLSNHLSAAQYKFIISQARFAVFSRTHAAIAAYSSLVPTLSIGYSSKSCGIASDLGMCDYMIRTEEILDKQDLVRAFLKLKKEEQNIKASLKKQMPQYIQNAINETIFQILDLKY